MQHVIELKDVYKHYSIYSKPVHRLYEVINPLRKKYSHDKEVLQGVNLNIEHGEVVGVLGQNGAGKSTLLKIISGIIPSDSGEVNRSGIISPLLELGGGLNYELSGFENIKLSAALNNIDSDNIDKYIQDIAEFSELGVNLEYPVKTYSSGMKSRLAFAIGIRIDPDILIIDEVLAVGDLQFRRKCYSKIRSFVDEGKTILFVSHDINSVIELCNRCIFLHDGKIVADGEPRKITAMYMKFLFSENKNIDNLLADYTAEDESTEAKLIEDNLSEETDYIAGMHAKTALILENDNVLIKDIHLIDSTGKRVNILRTGDAYKLIYTVSFDMDIEKVSIGGNINNEKGLFVTGAALHNRDDSIDVKNGDSFTVSWSFTNHLLKGVYYVNCGVAHWENDEWKVLTRVTDAVLFRVLKSENEICNGVVSLEQDIELDSNS